MSECARVTDRLSLLAAHMRAGGAAVGVGELLAAHRALAAVDTVSPTMPSSRCAPRCARRTPTSTRSRRRSRSSSPSRRTSRDPLQQLGRIERAVLPRIGIPMEADAADGDDDVPVPAA